jgi:hypothetical protein
MISTHLSNRARLAGAELGPSVGDQIQHRHAFCRACRVIVVESRQNDAVTETDVLGALTTRG